MRHFLLLGLLLLLPAAALAQDLTIDKARVQLSGDPNAQILQVNLEAKLQFSVPPASVAALLAEDITLLFHLQEGINGINQPCWELPVPNACLGENGKLVDLADCPLGLEIIDRADPQAPPIKLPIRSLDFRRQIEKSGAGQLKIDILFDAEPELAGIDQPCWAIPELAGADAVELIIGPASGQGLPNSNRSEFQPGQLEPPGDPIPPPQ